MKKVARMLRRQRPLLLNCFRARGEISAATVEGLQQQSKLTTRKTYGFCSYRCLEIALTIRWVSYRSPKRPTDSGEDQNSLTTLLYYAQRLGTVGHVP